MKIVRDGSAHQSVDLNCDMGESYGAWKMGADAQIMPYISSANIACGFHAGDPATIRKTVQLAPGGQVQFARCTLEQAGELRRVLRQRLDAALRALSWMAGTGDDDEENRP